MSAARESRSLRDAAAVDPIESALFSDGVVEERCEPFNVCDRLVATPGQLTMVQFSTRASR